MLKQASQSKEKDDVHFFFRASSGNQPIGFWSGILIPEPPCKGCKKIVELLEQDLLSHLGQWLCMACIQIWEQASTDV